MHLLIARRDLTAPQPHTFTSTAGRLDLDTPTMAAKRKAAAMAPGDDEPVDPSDELLFYCLGGGNEVGRSSHIIQYKGKTVMVCCSSHAGLQ